LSKTSYACPAGITTVSQEHVFSEGENPYAAAEVNNLEPVEIHHLLAAILPRSGRRQTAAAIAKIPQTRRACST
jgi:hypothetical protein